MNSIKKRKAQVPVIELMLIFVIGLALLTAMTFSYRQLSNNIWESTKENQFQILVNYIDSCFSTLTENNKNVNYAPTIQKMQIILPEIAESKYAIKGTDNEIIIQNEKGEIKNLTYPGNNQIIGYADSSNTRIMLVCSTNSTGHNIIEINGIN